MSLVFLKYHGVLYRRFAVDEEGYVYRWLKGKQDWKRLTAHPRGDGYLGFSVTHPETGKQQWVMGHAAREESFNGRPTDRSVACHGPKTKRSDIANGSCTFKTVKGNREDRRRDGTHSTGHNTSPGKLASIVGQILEMFDQGASQRRIAKLIGCSRAAVKYHLTRHRKVP